MDVFSVRSKLLKTIASSSTIKDSLTFRQQLELYHGISKLPDLKIKKLYFKIQEQDTKLPPPIKTNPKLEKIITAGLAIYSLKIPIPGLTLAINYIVDINRYKCVVRAEKSNVPNKDLAFSHCRYRAAAWGVKYVQGELAKCPSTENPKKCRNKLFKLLMTQKQKAAKAEGKLRWSIAKAKKKAIK